MIPPTKRKYKFSDVLVCFLSGFFLGIMVFGAIMISGKPTP